jgi:pyruvate kinase
MNQTKIVATLGPATQEPAAIRALAEAGVDVYRLNFSHSVPEYHAKLLNSIRAAAAELGRPLAVLQDLCGPKIRFAPFGLEPIELSAGDSIRVGRGPDPADKKLLWTTYERFVDDVKVGERVLVDDGNVELMVTDKVGEVLTLRTSRAGRISQGKGINLPGTEVSSPAVTEKDWADLAWGVGNGVDLVAVSFVRRAADVKQVKDHLRRVGSPAWVIAKIEKPQAVDNLEEIAAVADGLMVARGDLGVEMDVAGVPVIQKRMIRLCREMFKPVITATQMLQSMVDAPTPTRAEVSDVANAILDGSDAVMLSGETAVGKYPVEAVRMMVRIAEMTERWNNERGNYRPDLFLEGLTLRRSGSPPVAARPDEFVNISTTLARGLVKTALELGAKYIVVHSETGRLGTRISKTRPGVPIIAVTDRPNIYRQMNLLCGVYPVLIESAADVTFMTRAADRIAVANGWAKPGDLAVAFSRLLMSAEANTQTLMVHRVTG